MIPGSSGFSTIWKNPLTNWAAFVIVVWRWFPTLHSTAYIAVICKPCFRFPTTVSPWWFYLSMLSTAKAASSWGGKSAKLPFSLKPLRCKDMSGFCPQRHTTDKFLAFSRCIAISWTPPRGHTSPEENSIGHDIPCNDNVQLYQRDW